jgi:hypothetical protein
VADAARQVADADRETFLDLYRQADASRPRRREETARPDGDDDAARPDREEKR